MKDEVLVMIAERADVLIIGAGMAGATAAANLAATHKVILLEAEDTAGYHATGRSAAIWIRNYGAQDVRILTAASKDFFENPPPGFTETPLASPRPVLQLAPPEQLPALEELLSGGAVIERITPARAKEMVPALRDGYAAGAALETDCFDIEVAALHAGYLKQLRARGGGIALRHRAGRIWHEHGLWHAETQGGEVHAAPTLVNAAGAWGDVVAELAGEPRVGLQPKRRTACIIDPAPFDVRGWPLVGDVGHSWYARPEARSKIMLSPADETDCEPMDAWPDDYDVAIAVDRMQQALDIEVQRVEHSWAGLRTFAPDRSLVIGEGRLPGFFWMCGQGGYGIQTAPAAGMLIAAQIRDEAPPPGTEDAVALVDPRRFS
jgi:D-arginine dehydrogenase